MTIAVALAAYAVFLLFNGETWPSVVWFAGAGAALGTSWVLRRRADSGNLPFHPYLLGGILWTATGVAGAIVATTIYANGVGERDKRGGFAALGLLVALAGLAVGPATLRIWWKSRAKPGGGEDPP